MPVSPRASQRVTMRRIALASSVFLAACTQTVQLEPDPLGDLVTIELEPAMATLAISDLSEPPQTLAYHAIGVFSDGSRRDITAMIMWSVDNPAPGSFVEPGVYSTSNAAAGQVGVTARHENGVTATAVITVEIDAVIIDPAFPPPNPALFGSGGTTIAGDPTRAPSFLYPADGTVLPESVAHTLVQATLGAGNDELAITFDAAWLHVSVLTGADRWDTLELQQLLTQSSVDAPLHIGIAATSSTMPGTVYTGAPIAIEFASERPSDVIYFWSQATSGIMLGKLDQASAPKFYPPDTPPDTVCVGCHTSSRSGNELAMGRGSDELAPMLETIARSSLAPEIASTQGVPGGWSTYSPDGTLLLVATTGQLILRDAKTGAPIGSDGRIALPSGTYATHPDWSPDGTAVAVAYTATPPSNLSVAHGSIAILPYQGGGFGPPMVIVPAGAADNDYFPKFSPDGSYLAYVHANEPSYLAASAELWLVPATGGTPIALTAASHHVGSNVAATGLADTMPSWAPSTAARAFLAFASTRPYGAVQPSSGRAQIWIAAVDLTHPTPSIDPSKPAFWLPCQDVTVLNTMPVWAPDTATLE